MMREMAQPTQACAEVVREYIRPIASVLEGILTELRLDLPRERGFLVGNSIVAQCLFYRQNRSPHVNSCSHCNDDRHYYNLSTARQCAGAGHLPAS